MRTMLMRANRTLQDVEIMAATVAMQTMMQQILGFLHQPRYGRPALALDLMEEFRLIIADLVVLNIVNRRWLLTRAEGTCVLSGLSS